MKIYTLILVLALISTTGFSQRYTKGDDSLDKKVLAVEVTGPALLTMEMIKELQLTVPQQKEVEELNQQRYQQLMETELTAEARRDLVLQKVHLQNDKALKQVLSSEQLRRFLELEGRQNAEYLSELNNQ
ncbi:hypothetical protein H8S95_04240 [Pontibacter sp. KCTC 32443]|uniref:hypothetical protein n=1 Tax=Pontibacter TaxID=323449 RepID=UPI00164E77D0|nr:MULTISPECIES: hypothetical protein [Pontibacter]MBC5773264.1 hypothetical protein [Pontibacter sp. KCTC 32443]